jgi:hypothetical protein
MRLLTFNWHEAYVHMLASIGHEWDVVLRSKAGRADWWTEVRPLPDNVRLVSEADAFKRANLGAYDAAVCHNVLDLGLIADSGVPSITIFHTSRDLEVAYGLDVAAFDRFGRPLLERTAVVFVSSMKQHSWELEGEVIPPGIDVAGYGDYTGEHARVLHVGNMKRELTSVNGMAELEAAVAGLPFTLIGLNPTIPGSRLSRDWDDLRAQFRTHRVYLHTTRMPFEDGYNLAMLEAMATGMPVVALAHPTCPLTNERDGLVAADVDRLRIALLEMLDDPDRAQMLGCAARRLVTERFPFDAFASRWQALLDRVAVSGRRRGGEAGVFAAEQIG